MKKLFIKGIVVAIIILLSACTKQIKEEYMSVGGEEYPAIFVKSGYYFDKATMSDVTLSEMLSKITVVDKPKSFGTVELPDFSTITLTNNAKVEIDDAMIEAELEKERDNETTYVPIKVRREAKLKDKVIIDFKGYVNNQELEGGSGEDFELVLGSGQFIPGFEDQIVGHMAGRKFYIDVTFPTDYTEELAGKDAKFEVTIKSIEEAITSEVDVDFVRRHTKENSATVEQYREEVKRRIEGRNEFLNNQNLLYQLTDYLFENSKFEPTEEALAWQFSVVMDQYNKQAEQNGTNFASMVVSNGTSVKDAYEEIKSAMPQAVQSVMLMDALKKRFNETVTDDDAKKWFEVMSDAMGFGNKVTYEEYLNYMGLENLKETVLQEKVLRKVIALCNVVDEKVEE